MKSTVFKYELAVTDTQQITTAGVTKWLHVEMQRGQLCVWVLVNLDLPQETHHVRIIGTGHPIPAATRLRYLGSTLDGPYVWHVFLEE